MQYDFFYDLFNICTVITKRLSPISLCSLKTECVKIVYRGTYGPKGIARRQTKWSRLQQETVPPEKNVLPVCF